MFFFYLLQSSDCKLPAYFPGKTLKQKTVGSCSLSLDETLYVTNKQTSGGHKLYLSTVCVSYSQHVRVVLGEELGSGTTADAQLLITKNTAIYSFHSLSKTVWEILNHYFTYGFNSHLTL